MTDLALDEATWDLALPVAKTTGDSEVIQRLRIRLQFFLAEWFLDRQQGMPYFRDVLVKNPNLSVVRSLLVRAITDTRGVKEVRRCEPVLDSQSRTCIIDPLEIVLDDGSFLVKPLTFVIP